MRQALFFLGYVLFVNLLAALLCAYDKRQARRGGWRIRESTLLGLAAIGGAAGLLFAMRRTRHKTLHKRFSVGVPILLGLQLAAVAALLWLTFFANGFTI